MPTPAHRPQNSAWGCSIRGFGAALFAALLMALGLTGCSTEIPRANSNIAFMGDSITAFWWLPKANLGVYGNTTTQMLARFPEEVLGHGYRAVVILGGTNDIRGTYTPAEQTLAISNIGQMAAMAEKEGMEVILCEIPPIRGETERVVPFNAALASYAAEHGYKLVNYYAPMAGHPEYFRDGLHPNDLGYFAMQSVLTPVIPLDY